MLVYFIMCGIINLVLGFISGFFWSKRETKKRELSEDELENQRLAQEARDLQKSYK